MAMATREAYGKALVELGAKNKDVVVLDADLSKSTKTADFQKVYPDRFFNMGISEQDMMVTAAGLATCGKIPFASTFAIFATGRAYEQVRNSIGYPHLNVKIAATHAGITVGEDGATHQSIEDISLMRGIPGMVVINPADAEETRQAIFAAAEHYGPVYIRLGRMAVPDIHDQNYKFELGKGEVIREGKDVAIIATGIMVAIAIEAADKLKEEGIEATVVNIHTIKPIDKDLIVEVAKKTGKVITAEEHSIIGGLGSAVAEVLSEEYPVKIKRIGIRDEFGQSGSPKELLKHYGLTAEDIVKAAKSF
ncbi:transketolase subunit B [Thermoanaerobacter thermohydrosulfuricus]|mgnify:CR=1 FL=1|uniref:Transketolase, alpha subunit n=3 Tax=Thermoanaerobacter TaxID=1754 RepID=I9ACC6_9THEO|nr:MULTISPECIES: transketolase family protein [Thermoanaerobacter]EGD51937.1 Transketolase central region [Thermoanaerobacter ethanolicus JW 200]ABY92270.1 Transketolase, central region [Thermoanaerobacter sp. X514]EIV99676.1 transketolase, alpha subunit [Thermoanaerobacter siderophilus SR4]UZQ82496.1 transketolase family protein [Thermoanaerobacter sp. RKWS2]SDG60578.1 transketolase subunit B [Thermoanaerobacter thermohydrosulfuricus]